MREEHFSNYGSEWTKKYKPISVIESFDIIDGSEEDICTKKYMRKYGINNVRGGSYSKVVLDDYKIKALEDEFCTANNSCFKCGKTGHFSNQCSADVWNLKPKKMTEDHEKKCDIKIPIKSNTKKKTIKGNCNRCCRKGHYQENCYATTDIYGQEIESSDDDNDSDSYDDYDSDSYDDDE